MSRFVIYSPLVYSLHVFQNTSQEYKVSSWPSLIRWCDFITEHTLLPNLQRLIVDSCSNTNLVKWTFLLLMPSLIEIRLLTVSETNPPWIPESDASTLLAHVAKLCPSLQTLAILAQPDNDNEDEDDIGLGILPCLSEFTSYEYIANMNCLRDLSIGKYFLETESFVSIGLLPALETLFVHESCKETELAIFHNQLPDFLFPSLRHLTLHLIDSCEIARIWQIDSLVKNLIHANIEAVPPDSEYRQEEGKYGLIDWLPDLFQNSLHIQHLSAGFKVYGFTEIQTLESSSLSTILQLPLQHLSLPVIEIVDFEEFCQLFSESCPGLRRLDIPHTEVGFSVLPHITEYFMRLEHLSVNISWDVDDIPELSQLGQPQTSLRSLEYSTYEYADPDDDLTANSTIM
ncbi:LRR receptor-like serine/threonine-protein kinase [Ceratobasidium sp. AG-Ba]|nr:LRR receptor-like serine/threonine-protein kinase [Ceratobasidium sp. AG-Ba]